MELIEIVPVHLQLPGEQIKKEGPVDFHQVGNEAALFPAIIGVHQGVVVGISGRKRPNLFSVSVGPLADEIGIKKDVLFRKDGVQGANASGKKNQDSENG